PRGPGGDAETEQAARGGEHDALDEKLSDDAPAAGAERESYGDFLLPRRRTRDQQARDVGARDEQHAADDIEEDFERAFELLPNRRPSLGRWQEAHLALEKLFARVRRRAAERRHLHFLLE